MYQENEVIELVETDEIETDDEDQPLLKRKKTKTNNSSTLKENPDMSSTDDERVAIINKVQKPRQKHSVLTINQHSASFTETMAPTTNRSPPSIIVIDDDSPMKSKLDSLFENFEKTCFEAASRSGTTSNSAHDLKNFFDDLHRKFDDADEELKESEQFQTCLELASKDVQENPNQLFRNFETVFTQLRFNQKENTSPTEAIEEPLPDVEEPVKKEPSRSCEKITATPDQIEKLKQGYLRITQWVASDDAEVSARFARRAEKIYSLLKCLSPVNEHIRYKKTKFDRFNRFIKKCLKLGVIDSEMIKEKLAMQNIKHNYQLTEQQMSDLTNATLIEMVQMTKKLREKRRKTFWKNLPGDENVEHHKTDSALERQLALNDEIARQNMSQAMNQ